MSDRLDDDALRRLLSMAADDEGDGVAPPPLPERYELVREIGRGGMGVVYECVDNQLQRPCAVKTLGAGAGADAALRRRFAREALAAARLRHPHIAEVYDATEDYISMRLVRGGPIDVDNTNERAARRRVVGLVRDAARALQHAHESGVVHRDIKPSNLLVEGEHVFVVDFGLAKALDVEASVSLAGTVVGTPAFMAPEQALGRGADPRTDVYGLGATLHCCLTGRPPFAADDLPTLLRLVIEQDTPPTGADKDLDVVVQKCLAKEPDRRYGSAAAFADDLDRWLADEPIHARPPSFGYRLQKRLRRQRTLWRAAAGAALAAVVVTALVLVPMMLRESAARSAASEAVELADHTAAVLENAAMYYRFGDPDSARSVLDAGIAHVQDYLGRHDVPRARYLMSRLLEAAGRRDQALAELTRTIAQDPTLADARFERGLLLVAGLDPDAATAATARADLSAPAGERSVLTSVDRLFGQAELLRLGGELEPAAELLREVLEYDAMHVGARLSLARVASLEGDHDLARYYAASAVDLQQGFGPFYLARERRLLPTTMLGLDGALLDFAIDLAAGLDNAMATAHRGLVHLRRGLRLARDGDDEAARQAVAMAVDDYDTTVAMHDWVAGPHNNRAVCHCVAADLAARAGDGAAAAAARQAATDDLDRALQIDARLPEVHHNRGLVLLRTGDVLMALGRRAAAVQRFEAAVAAFGDALARKPDGWQHEAVCRRLHEEAQSRLAALVR